RQGGLAANEVVLFQVYKAAETGFIGSVDGSVLTRPGAEALLYPHGVQRPAAEGLESIWLARRLQQIKQRTLIVPSDPDPVTQIPRKRYAAHERRDHPDIHAPERHERKLAQIIAHERLQQRP